MRSMSSSPRPPSHLFVYGTLRSDLRHPLHHLLRDGATRVGEGSCAGRLYDLGHYPGLVSPASADERVRGEVYRLDVADRVLTALDVYEGCGPEDPQPQEYRRAVVDVTLATGSTVAAWAYIYNGSVASADWMPSGEYTVSQTVSARAEGPQDYAAIDAVHRAAFGRDMEGRLVRALRGGDTFDPDLSLVALRGGQIAGHILFSSIRIVGAAGAWPAIALAPMAVVPPLQRQGIGSALLHAGLAACRERGHRLIVVVGHPEYCPRFGFQPARPAGLEAPFPVPDEAFMVAELAPGALAGVRGVVQYPQAFQQV